MKLPKKQEILLNFLSKRAANGAIKITNSQIAKDLFESNIIAPNLSNESVSALIAELGRKNLIRTEIINNNTRNRIIYLI